MAKNEFYNALRVLSYNAIFNFIVTNRNYGKTWAFKRRAFVRGLKRGKTTLWLRTFKEEVKEAATEFYNSADLQKFCGISVYDKEQNPNGNFKQVGYNFFVKRGKGWHCFLKLCRVGAANALRSVDNINFDTIVYDEFTTTAEREKRYKGNRVNDFIDLFVSAKRQHIIRCFFLGNKENTINPFLNYFHLKQLPATYEGIRTYKEGSILIQQINNLPPNKTTYDAKLTALFENTLYGAYMYASEYKDARPYKKAKAPSTAELYIQIYVNGFAFKILVDCGFFYINQNIDTSKPVYCIKECPHKYTHEMMLTKSRRIYFKAFTYAIELNRVYYVDTISYTITQPFVDWLGVL